MDDTRNSTSQGTRNV